MNAIEIRDLRMSFGPQVVLDGIDLTVSRGSVFALLGPNGAGKTTMINILSTLLRPDGGTARVCGHDVITEPEAVRRVISVTGQNVAVDQLLTGEENLRLVARLSGLDRRAAGEAVERLLTQFELTDAGRRRVGRYSGGMRRRLDLALGLVSTPEVVILDEPTTGLDTMSRQSMWSIISRLAGDGVTILLTTQYLEEADQLADEVALINNGQVVVQGTPATLKALVGSERLELRRRSDDALVAEIPVDGTPASVRSALDRLGDGDGDGYVVLRKPTLDDAFVLLTSAPVLAEVA